MRTGADKRQRHTEAKQAQAAGRCCVTAGAAGLATLQCSRSFLHPSIRTGTFFGTAREIVTFTYLFPK